VNKTGIATFGGGCFWCIEAVLQRLRGVESVVSGYAGGHTVDPTYRSTSKGDTGHAEVVQVTFDPTAISYEELVTIFMTSHDPTTVDRQGADRGPQYRSIILHHNVDQKAIVENVLSKLKNTFDVPVVTEVAPINIFYRGEAYHQNYYNNNPSAGYCRVVIDPKVGKLRKMYADRLKLEIVE
jgi:peptide-methionine (S)-S-oxide reductase